VLDASGNLYGATRYGGAGDRGAVYELIHSGVSWTATVLSTGGSDSTLARADAGNLYGTTCTGGAHNSGTVFKLSPTSGGGVKTVLHDFTGGADGYCPLGNVMLGADGTLCGTTIGGGAHQWGVVFEVTP
jgi:uncharacterized repeat protein (TIGR03803 family)